MIKIAHISDLHVRNYKFYNEFDKTINNLIVELEKVKPDLIVFTGDCFHTKIQISGEAILLAQKFFSGLTKIAPVKVILGNHDINVNNSNRISPVIPVCNVMENLELYYGSGLYNCEVAGKNVCFAVYSIVDNNDVGIKNIKNNKQIKKSDISIGLAHICVRGSDNETGFLFTSEHDLSMFNGLDFVMLGDIHKHQFLDEDKRCAYAGSLLQNNFGESLDSGFLLWKIDDRDSFDTEFVVVDSPLKFYTINVDKECKIPSWFNPKPNSRIRIAIDDNVNFAKLAKFKSKIISKFKPKDIREIHSSSMSFNSDDFESLKVISDNIRNRDVQSSLIRNYFKNKDIKKSVIDSVVKLNLDLDDNLSSDGLVRNVVWDFDRLRFGNYFNYGRRNIINFSKLDNKINLISGQNAIGKSAAIDTICHIMHNTTNRLVTKNIEYINSRAKKCFGELILKVGGNKYKIVRTVQKIKNSSGVIQSKTDLDFFRIDSEGNDICLNGEQRFDTEKNIRSMFGSVDDLFLSSVASQGDIMSFINKGATLRKEIIMKFLDLYFFEERYDLVNDNFRSVKSKLKQYDDIDFDEEIEGCKSRLGEFEKELKKNNNIYVKELKCLNDIDKKVSALHSKVVDVDLIDIKDVNIKLGKADDKINGMVDEIFNVENSLLSVNEKLDISAKILSEYNFEEMKTKKSNYDSLLNDVDNFEGEKGYKKDFLCDIENRVKILSKIPCGDLSDFKDVFSKCPLILDAVASRDKLEGVRLELEELGENINECSVEIFEIEESGFVGNYNKIEKIISNEHKLNKSKSEILNDLSNKKSIVSKLKESRLELLKKVEVYNNDKNQIELNKELNEQIRVLMAERPNKAKVIKKANENIADLNKSVGSVVTTLNEWKIKRLDYDNCLKKYNVYSLLSDCLGKNGIPKQIISKNLPIINNTINLLLSDVVSFKILLDYDSNSNIFINLVYPDTDPRPVQIASGMEKTISSIAIRAGLCLVSSIPRSSSFIIDEGFSALDGNKVESMSDMLVKLKQYFKNIIIVTHIDSLKDVADNIIDIDLDQNHNAKIVI
jgi:DNA repair exonuclease SbcCD ATPase subunit/DNA repair exonuclease SbcCD nuclease subunit